MDGMTMSMRELSVLETSLVGGAFSWWEFGGHVFTGALGGALVGSMVGGVGAGPGALAGGLIGGIEYSLQSFINWCL
jgi:hypothetical protein